MDIKEQIFKFVSRHESIISHEMNSENIKTKFTTFGNKAACRAIYDIIEILDDNTKLKVIEMMKNKKS
jgi:hypothetical protein